MVVEELSTRMAAKGHKVVLYNRKGHNVSGAEYDTELIPKYKGVIIKEVFTIDRKGLAAFSSSFFATIKCIFGGYDIVHIHAEGPAVMCALLKLCRKKVVVTIHGIDWERAKWKNKVALNYIRFGEKTIAKYADAIIVLSRAQKDYFKNTYNVRTRFIPNGVNKPNIRPADKITALWGLNTNDYILFLGRMVPEKGIHYLIKAFKGVKTGKKLVIAGGCSDTKKYVTKMEELAADDERIIFTGFVQGRIKHELYSNAYVYTLPSDLEGMPLSLLEAMSYGNCCLTSDIDECKEVVGENAVIFRNADIADLREKLQTLCDDPQMVERYRKGSADRVLSRFKWDDTTDRVLDLYRTVCNKYEGVKI